MATRRSPTPPLNPQAVRRVRQQGADDPPEGNAREHPPQRTPAQPSAANMAPGAQQTGLAPAGLPDVRPDHTAGRQNDYRCGAQPGI